LGDIYRGGEQEEIEIRTLSILSPTRILFGWTTGNELFLIVNLIGGGGHHLGL
jgi:hypothetical protein